jgi:hypothetical protein
MVILEVQAAALQELYWVQQAILEGLLPQKDKEAVEV